MNIPTADEFLQSRGCSKEDTSMYIFYNDVEAIDLIEFVKLHLKAQEEAILNLVSMNINSGNVRYTSLDYPGKSGKETITVDKRSIKGAYPLENVK